MHGLLKTACLVLAPVAFALVPAWGQGDPIPPHPTDGVIYEDNLNGSGGLLHGRVVDETNGIAWEAGDRYLDSGEIIPGSAQATFLPFNPVANVEYTAEASIQNPTGQWVAFGFRSAGDDWTASGGAMRHITGGYAWMLTNSTTQEAFTGPGTANKDLSGIAQDATVPLRIKIVLNTFETPWRVEYYINDNSYGIYDVDDSAIEAIAGIGFSHNNLSGSPANAFLSDFRLSASTTPTIPPSPPPPTDPRPPVETGVVYRHDFGGSGDPLNETNVDVGGAAWEAGDLFRDDGTVGILSSGGQAAWLPFDPGAGGIYIADATVLNPGDGWIAFGFLRESVQGPGGWTQTAGGVRHVGAGGYAWMLTRGDGEGQIQQIFDGPDATSNIFSGNATGQGPNDPVEMRIVLNTMREEWTASYFINGKQIGGTRTLPALASDRLGEGIGGIGFSRSRGTGEAGVISNFSLTGVSGDLLIGFEVVDADIDPAAGTATLSWGSAEGASYRVEMSENLVDWVPVAEGVEATGETTTYEATGLDLTGDRKFFRVALEL